MFKKIIYITIISITLLFSCKKVSLEHISKIQTGDHKHNSGYINLGGTVVDIPETGLLDYGHCISLGENPTLKDITYNLGTCNEQTTFESALANLEADKTYYYRAFAITEKDTIYGTVKSFNTNDFNSITITTSNPQITGNSSISVNGSIGGLASLNALEYGHCWSTSTNPNINNIKSNFGPLSTDINYSSNITDVPLDVTYYLKSYLKLSNNTVLYGNQQQIVIPDLHVTTDTFNIPTTNNATLQGNILSLGINSVTDHGHCYSTTTSNPNINNTKLSLGSTSTTGVYYTTLNLQSGITYYYRSYAITGNKVKYGVVKKIVN